MIATKHARCIRFVLAYVRRYGPVRAAEIPTGGTYTREEIARALEACEGLYEDIDGWRAARYA